MHNTHKNIRKRYNQALPEGIPFAEGIPLEGTS